MTKPTFFTEQEITTLYKSFTEPSYTEQEVKEFVCENTWIDGRRPIPKEIKVKSFNSPTTFLKYQKRLDVKYMKRNYGKGLPNLGCPERCELDNAATYDPKTKFTWMRDNHTLSREQLHATQIIWRICEQAEISASKLAQGGGQLLRPDVPFYLKKGITIMQVWQTKSMKYDDIKDVLEVIILDTPKCSFDDRNRFHSIVRPAVVWGEICVYSIHGVNFDNRLWNEIVERKMEPTKVLTIDNIEQRRVASEYYGMEKLWDACKPKLIDTSERGNRLYNVTIGELSWRRRGEDHNAKMLRYKDPSTDREYVSGVPLEDDDGNIIDRADQAMAWKFHLTEDEYKELTVEG